MYSLVDSHCHLHLILEQDKSLSLAQIIDGAKKAQISKLLCVATKLTDTNTILAMCEQYPEVYGSVGVHPLEPMQIEPKAEEIVALAKSRKVVAIGETGLDFYRTDQNEPQTERFRQHIRAAISLNKPIIVHTRQARDATIQILREENVMQCGGVLHCFTEDWAMAKSALDLGLYISMSGIVTFKKSTELQDVAKKIPLDRLLVETDSPYLAPTPLRGKINLPEYVLHVANFIAELRNIPLVSLARQTTQNCVDLFKF